jgi:hypothetical protein
VSRPRPSSASLRRLLPAEHELVGAPHWCRLSVLSLVSGDFRFGQHDGDITEWVLWHLRGGRIAATPHYLNQQMG